MKRLFVTYKSLTLSLLFIFLFSVTVSFASPLYNSSNTTLDPQCTPSNTNCRVATSSFSEDLSVGSGFVVTTANSYTGTGSATAGAPRLFIGTNTSSGDDSAILIGRGLLGTSLFSHAIRDESTFNSTLDSAYASFDSNPQMLGSQYYNHFRSFQSRPNYSGTNHVSLLNGFNYQPVVSSGVVDQSIGFMITDKIGSGTVTNNIGILIEALTSGTATNYAIYSQGSAPSYFGGSLQLGAGLRTTQVTASGLGGTYGAIVSASGDGDLINNPSLTIVNGVLTMSHGFGSKILSSNSDLQLESTYDSIRIRPAGATSATFSANGRLGLGTITPTSKLFVQSTDAAVPGLTIKAASGQSAPLFSLVNNAGDTILEIPNLLTAYSAANTVIGVSAGANINPIQYNSQTYGLITGGTANTIFGYQAGTNLVDGNENTLIGYKAGHLLIGANGGDPNFTGSLNTIIGANAGANLYTGTSNTLIGQKAGTQLTSGNQNILIGKAAGEAITSQNGNVMIGVQSGKYVTDAAYNTYVGVNTGTYNNGVYNVLLGADAGYNYTTINTFIAGSDGAGSINDVYFGKGKQSALPTNYTIHGTNGFGSNINGGDITIASGAASGVGASGAIIFANSKPISSGTQPNYLQESMRIVSLADSWRGGVGIGTDTPIHPLDVTDPTQGKQNSGIIANFTNSGASFDTWSNNLTSDAGNFVSTATRRNGSGDLTNRGIYVSASGGQYNYAAIFDQGLVGIGTTSPEKSLHIFAPDQQNARIRIQNNQGRKFDLVAGVTNFSQVGFSIHDATADVTRLVIDNDGLVGIGTVTPSYMLSVGSSSVSGIVSSFQNSTGTCTINPTTTSLSCSSDYTLKKNITTLTNTPWTYQIANTSQSNTILQKVLALQPVQYNWNSESDTDAKHTGFIAQDVQQLFPDLVQSDPRTHLLSVNYIGLLPYTVQALQELNVKVSAIPTYTDTTLYTTISTFLDGIAQRGEAVVNKVQTKEIQADTICLKKSDGSSLCLTGDQLQGVLSTGNIVAPSIPAPQQEVLMETPPPSEAETPSEPVQ